MAAKPLRRPSSKYSRVFSTLTAGIFLLITGVIGWNVSYLRGMFEGGRWQDGPVWWQIALGSALLLLGIQWARRIIFPGAARPDRPEIKWVGRGRA